MLCGALWLISETPPLCLSEPQNAKRSWAPWASIFLHNYRMCRPMAKTEGGGYPFLLCRFWCSLDESHASIDSHLHTPVRIRRTLKATRHLCEKQKGSGLMDLAGVGWVEIWLRGLDSNQDSRLQRPMCYQLHHPGSLAGLIHEEQLSLPEPRRTGKPALKSVLRPLGDNRCKSLGPGLRGFHDGIS